MTETDHPVARWGLSRSLGADLTFAAGAVDRCAHERDDAGLLGRLLADRSTRVVPVHRGSFRVDDAPADAGAVLASRAPEPEDANRLAVFLGRDREDGGRACVGVVLTEVDQARQGPGWSGLRSIAVALAPAEAALAATIAALANWHATHTHCPRCGAATTPAKGGWVRRCVEDDSEHFPRTDPAIIVAVQDQRGRLLLARGAGFTSAGMSVLAGFVEPGETLTQAVVREVAEEVGLAVTDVEYLADQPWPFPSGLMVGFRARATSTTLRLQPEEIVSARWFTREEFARAVTDRSVEISGRLSIARRLIEHWWGGPLDLPDVSLRL